jgi:hypothetical protein
MRDRLRTTWLTVEFFTHSHRISGRVDVHQLKLADQLNDQSTQFLRLEEAYVSNIERPADIVANHEDAFLWKDKIVAVLVARQEDALPRERSYGSYFGTHLSRVFITLPAFEVRGYLRLSSKLDMRLVLTTGTDDFVLIQNGEMRSAIRPDLVFGSDAILIQKRYVEVFWTEEDSGAENG